MNFKSKPPYGPIIDIVNCLAENNDVLYSHPHGKKAHGLNDDVLNDDIKYLETSKNLTAFRPQIVFSAASSLAFLAYLKVSTKVPILNYRFMHTPLSDIFSHEFRSYPRSYLVRELSNMMMFGIPKRMWLPERLLLPNCQSRNHLETLGINREILEVLPWGIDVRKYDRIKFNCSSDSSNAANIVYAGPLHKLRFSTDIIDAFAAISHVHSDATLSLLFRGIWDPKLLSKVTHKIKEYKIETRVKVLTRPLPYEDLMVQFAKARIVVLPYLLSGVVEMPPFTLLEAMALSKAVVTNAGIATREIIKSGYNGIISQQNKEGYMESFRVLLSDDDKTAAIGRRARESILKRFNIVRFCSRLQAVMEAMV
ncbi:MAG: glycosyltransferase [Candidatus Thorarchaeota archaeon]|jgi:glycosyltransferase involved in cell wall biosynthesis